MGVQNERFNFKELFFVWKIKFHNLPGIKFFE